MLDDFENNKINNYYNEISRRFQPHLRFIISLHFHIRYEKYLILCVWFDWQRRI